MQSALSLVNLFEGFIALIKADYSDDLSKEREMKE